jgi:hypothetical protein
MAGKRGLTQRLQAEIRRRRERPRPHAVPTGDVRSDRREEITRNHANLLFDIESLLVDCWRQNEGIDDHWAHMGLVAAMREDPPDDSTAYVVFRALTGMRSLREEIDSELWLDALRVVDQSLRSHSSLRHGDRSYLSFAAAFLAEATGMRSDYKIVEGRVTPPEPPI